MLWLALFAAAEIIYVLQRGGRILVVLTGLLVVFRASRLLIGDDPRFTAAYEMTNNLFFALAAAALIISKGPRLHRQIVTFLGVSIPVMIGQLIGWPDWLHAIRTDAHGEGIEGTQMMQTLFNPDKEAGYTTIQSRPAGLLHANNFLSVVILFAMAIQFGRSRGRNLSRGDVFLVAVMVLAMAKIAYLAFIVFTVVHLIWGTSDQKALFGKRWVLALSFLTIFYFFFPGVFLYDLSPNNIYLNYAVRVADLRAAISGISDIQVGITGIGGEQLFWQGYNAGSESGYAAIAQSLKLLAPIFLIGAVVFFRRLSVLREGSPEIVAMARNGFVILILAPLVTSFFGNPFFSFAMGPVFCPWLVYHFADHMHGAAHPKHAYI
ncbi:MAG: hypothetical protein H0W69_07260 [Gemmatimonadaceae bacterium]|nr:hypothetical protein [Gemmatimonadaceae bacterium]